MNWLLPLALLIGLVFSLLLGWRELDRRSDDKVWQQLAATSRQVSSPFDPKTIATLPEPAQRYFRFSIRPGSQLHGVIDIEMTGELGFGTKDDPAYRPMLAQQILAPPHGLVWKLNAGPIAGSDAATPDGSWTRFWLFGVVPVVRAGGNADHHRSALGRVVAEGAFWAPATLLPSAGVRWEPLDDSSARAIVRFPGFEQAVDITVADDGQPTQVLIQRWSNENPAKVFQEQPFGGYLSEFREFDGYRLPTVVEGGNHFGTDDYFAFYKARVTAIRFPSAGAAP